MSSAQLRVGQISKRHNELLQRGSNAVEKTIQDGKAKLFKLQIDEAVAGREVTIKEYCDAGNQMANGLLAIKELEKMQIASPSLVKEAIVAKDSLLQGKKYQNPRHNPNLPLGGCDVCFEGFNVLSDSSYEVEPILPILFAIARGAKTMSMDGAESATVVLDAADVQSKMDFMEMTLLAQEYAHDELLLVQGAMTDTMEKEVNEYHEHVLTEHFASKAVATASSPVKSNIARKLPVVTQSTMGRKEPFDEDDEDDRVVIMGESSAVARMPSQDETMEKAYTVQNEDCTSGRKRLAQEMNTSGKMNDEDMKQQIQILKNKYGKRFM